MGSKNRCAADRFFKVIIALGGADRRLRAGFGASARVAEVVTIGMTEELVEFDSVESEAAGVASEDAAPGAADADVVLAFAAEATVVVGAAG